MKFNWPKIKLPTWAILSVKILITGAILFLLYRKLDWSDILVVLQQADGWWLLPALLTFIVSKIAIVPRLGLHLKVTANCIVPFYTNLRLFLAGMYYSLFLPGSVGGDGYKVIWLRREYEISTPKAIRALLEDRFSGLLALGVWCVLLLLLSGPQVWLQLFTLSFGLAWFQSIFTRKVWLLWSRSFMWSMLGQGLQVLCAYFILVALRIEDQQILYLMVFLVSSVVAALLPMTVGGVGSRELVFLYASDFLPLSADSSVVLAFIFYLISTFVSLSGIYYVIREKEIE